jgi:DnaJ-class molecular chaperone
MNLSCHFSKCLRYHPDISNNEDAEEKFKSIQEAYQILGDERKKVEYDMSLNEGYYGGPRAQPGTGGSAPHSWKRRGPAYTGRSTAYDFDEHFKAHYARTRPSSVNYKNSFRDSQFGKTYQEELNDYWNTKEFSNQDGGREMRNQFISKSLYALMILFLLSLYLHWSVVRESERGLKNYQVQQAKMSKNNSE